MVVNNYMHPKSNLTFLGKVHGKVVQVNEQFTDFLLSDNAFDKVCHYRIILESIIPNDVHQILEQHPALYTHQILQQSYKQNVNFRIANSAFFIYFLHRNSSPRSMTITDFNNVGSRVIDAYKRKHYPYNLASCSCSVVGGWLKKERWAKSYSYMSIFGNQTWRNPTTLCGASVPKSWLCFVQRGWRQSYLA